MVQETHIVPTQSRRQRLQDYGVGIFLAIPTKSALKKAIKKELVLVDGKLGDTAMWIAGGETITVNFPEEDTQIKRLIFPLKVTYEDDYLACILKPGGILVSGNGFKTIAHALVQNLSRSNSTDTTKPQPVHRLDYATTGILLVGKTNDAIRTLNRLFENKKIQKEYYAITIGKMENRGEISLDIDTKSSLTEYEVVDSVVSPRFERLNLVKLNPKTGRRHQLRKHLSALGNPILGDQTYGKEELILKGKGLYLHAFSLEFKHPETKNTERFTAELPERFYKIFPNLNVI
ncbi:MAG: 23S rRNA pseudouridine1911/1915/1917 synthase [Luteibaculaceae bacterium]|jgi:23S rRNA pseudouridine1911/1915/1917 synthase